MTFASDDLAPLLAAAGQESNAGVTFGQGVVRGWDPLTGENQIDFRGALLRNLPILNTAEAISLRPGSIVGILGWRTSYFILGRVTRPNDPDFASASVEFAAESDSVNNFSLSTTETTKLTVTIAVPPWADQALITGHMQMVGWPANAGELAPIVGRVRIGWDTGSTTGPGMGADLVTVGKMVMVSAGKTGVITTPGTTITVDARAYAGAAIGANISNTVALQASAVFRSVPNTTEVV